MELALHFAARWPFDYAQGRMEGSFFKLTRHLRLIPGQPGLGDIPDYYQTSLAGLEYGWVDVSCKT
jgi:hypothetical protein